MYCSLSDLVGEQCYEPSELSSETPISTRVRRDIFRRWMLQESLNWLDLSTFAPAEIRSVAQAQFAIIRRMLEK